MINQVAGEKHDTY